MRWLLSFVIAIFLVSFVAAVPHAQFNAFSAAEDFSVENNVVSVTDDAVYQTGWYSVNGASWRSFSLQGAAYPGGAGWLLGTTSITLPSFGFGEHYVIIYSCSDPEAWDCHNTWQLHVINNVPPTQSNCDGTPNGICGEGCDRYDDIDCTFNTPDCSDTLDYQCGSRDICGSTVDYDDCDSGYDCVDNLCIASVSTCDGVSCPTGEYCSNGVCLLDVPGDTYFVATWGDDDNPGTFEQPFYTWQQAVDVSYPGDITYFRGGVWMPANRDEDVGMRLNGPEYGNNARLGTSDAWIRYFNYPGERPILDKRYVEPSDSRWGSGISMNYMGYIHLKGLTVRHVYQSPPDFTHGKPHSEVSGIGCGVCANMKYENLVAHDINGRAFQHWSGAWTEIDVQNGYNRCLEEAASDPEQDPADCEREEVVFESDETSWINCDAYNLYDRYASSPGNAADGWKVGTYYGGVYTWDGCRAWNYSDDGFDPHGSGLRFFDSCWATSGNFFDAVSDWGMEGNGFKLTGISPETFPNYELGGEVAAIIMNSVAADCDYMGFYNNILVNYENQWPNNGVLLNNFAYDNYHGFHVEDGSQMHNNVVFENSAIGPTDNHYEVTGNRIDYIESHNNWDNLIEGGSPSYVYASEFDVTDEDFISLDVTQLSRPRKKDFSLPDIDFARLARDSELIDGGIAIDGYHCPTAGTHPGSDCVVWYGAAPDVGPFESNYLPLGTPTCTDGVMNGGESGLDCGGSCYPCECSAGETSSCLIYDGAGERSRSCTNGRYSSWTDCVVSSCDDGYYEFDNECEVFVGGEELINSCQELDTSGTMYLLTSDVTADASCMMIFDNYITLDCQGHTITYSTGSGTDDVAIDVVTRFGGGNFFTIKNCVIEDDNYPSGDASSNAIEMSSTQGGILENNNIRASGRGIYQVGAIGTRYINNIVSTNSGIALYSQSSSDIISGFFLSGNTFTSIENYGAYLYRSNGDVVINNTFISPTNPLNTLHATNMTLTDNTLITS